MVETEITNILEDYIDNDEDYFKVVDFIENQDKMLYAKNHTNKILINEKKELKDRINKAIKYTKELYEIAKEQDSENVNLIDRLEIILKTLRGEDNE